MTELRSTIVDCVTKRAPVQFLRNPSLWLDAVTRFRATTIGGPNFAYDLCVERIPDESLCGTTG